MVVEIDPDGDILMNCSGTVTFLVSKKALSLASPVLTWMLKPPADGGLAIKHESSKYSMVNLPHQDPEAFRIFCEVVHHKSASSSRIPTPRCLLHIAHIVDEFNCAKAMVYAARVWLSQPLRVRSRDNLWDLIQLAYIVNLKSHFYEISRELLWTSTERFGSWKNACDDFRIFSISVLDSFDNKLDLGTQRVQQAIMYDIDTFSLLDCRKANIFMRDYIRAVKDAGILPGSNALASKSFQQIYHGAKHIGPNIFTGEENCNCSSLSGHMQREELIARLDECWNGMGLCLPCVKSVACEEHPTP